jgi:hypothetical protein
MLLVFVFFTYKCKVFNKNVKILERERERVNVCGKKTWPIPSTFDFSIKKILTCRYTVYSLSLIPGQ